MILFLFESASGLIFLYGFYYLFLRNGNDFRLQRFFLISIGIIPLFLPLLNIRLPSDTIPITGQLLNIREEYVDLSVKMNEGIYDRQIPFDLPGIILTVYFTGVFFFLVRLIHNVYKPLKIARRYGIERKGKLNFIYSDTIHSPFSIFNFIFLTRSHVSRKIMDKVIAHEEIHVSQKHTLDLVFIELLMIFQWFNPVVFQIRKSMQEVHEFLADEGVIKRGHNPASYAGLILQQVSRKPMMGLVTSFNSLTRKRIVMITRNNVKKKFKLCYLFILPVIALLFFAFSTDRQPNRVDDPMIFSSSLSRLLDTPWSQDENTPSIWPVDKEKCRFTSRFGERIHPIYKEKMMHKGIDLAAAEGTPVKVTADGIVEKTEDWPEGYGKYIIVVHDDVYTTLYAQLSEMKVKVGDRVYRGEVIGLVGSSGLSTAPHLHYEVRKDGEPVDPAGYFDIK